ncbi:MAG: response regulator receiver protein [Anaerolineae bacterium]|nr:response regulator receiver protein [Anaerolineae bacterium]
MFFTEWEVLLVDDEPDVLAISKLAMKDFEVYGLPLKIHTAKSKAEAIEFLNHRPDHYLSRLAVIFTDVVMESDTAGLELCHYIREDMDNRLTQLFVRTGQPGTAPEREVIDRYDISGYFTKAETTEDKLYSLVKSGVRQYLWAMMAVGSYAILNHTIANASSRHKIEATLQMIMAGWDSEGVLAQEQDAGGDNGIGYALLLDGKLIHAAGSVNEQSIKEQLARLDQFESQPLSPDGDRYVADTNHNQLIDIAAQPSNPPIQWFFRTTFEPPEYCITLFYSAFKNVAVIWQQSS